MAGLFSPQAFLTATLQNHARKYKIDIDSLEFGFEILRKQNSEAKLTDGCYIKGLYLEGIIFDISYNQLIV